MPLTALERALQNWLRTELPLPEDVGDVSFESPEGTWGTSISRPTVNLFLFDIARGAQQSVPLPPRRGADGVLVQERPAPSMCFWYLLSAWGGGVREEHQLLGDAVKAVLRTSFLTVPDDVPDLVGPVALTLAESGQTRGRELWGNLGGKLRASFVLGATTAVTLDRTRPVAPSVELVRVGAVQGLSGDEDSADPAGRRFVWFGQNRQRGRDQG
ncbi:DUF4255 domain-containing protein [Kineosporia sp. J2-2]|uniref:DUF4255 domain-containing protein n=1 Tax=Kineosporia corallincola TaxID=2835133 RepID=A0ABS5TAV0_9ACTN|nr:DUF4255 domain-containing protein [Kineosporia corallincola]MBT0768198.1 DUF4255 domain-containing protein [Kineosporia corallincola]